jgi:hypothetical protein
MHRSLAAGERYVRNDLSEGMLVSYQVSHGEGAFYAWWGVGLRVKEVEGLELAHWMKHEHHDEAVDYLVAHREVPVRYGELLWRNHGQLG